jgi:hypothetical protein
MAIKQTAPKTERTRHIAGAAIPQPGQVRKTIPPAHSVAHTQTTLSRLFTAGNTPEASRGLADDAVLMLYAKSNTPALNGGDISLERHDSGKIRPYCSRDSTLRCPDYHLLAKLARSTRIVLRRSRYLRFLPEEVAAPPLQRNRFIKDLFPPGDFASVIQL